MKKPPESRSGETERTSVGCGRKGQVWERARADAPGWLVSGCAFEDAGVTNSNSPMRMAGIPAPACHELKPKRLSANSFYPTEQGKCYAELRSTQAKHDIVQKLHLRLFRLHRLSLCEHPVYSFGQRPSITRPAGGHIMSVADDEAQIGLLLRSIAGQQGAARKV
jgi:hypothetical protein